MIGSLHLCFDLLRDLSSAVAFLHTYDIAGLCWRILFLLLCLLCCCCVDAGGLVDKIN